MLWIHKDEIADHEATITVGKVFQGLTIDSAAEATLTALTAGSVKCDTKTCGIYVTP